MTQELLNKVAKAKKINLSNFDSVIAYINDNYTKIHVSFGVAQVCGGVKTIYNQKNVTLSVMAILKREEEFPEDYETQGWQFFDYLK